MRCEICTEIHAERAKKYGIFNEQIAEEVACAMFMAAGSHLSWSEVYDRIIKEQRNIEER